MIQAFYLLFSYVNRLMCVHIMGFFMWCGSLVYGWVIYYR